MFLVLTAPKRLVLFRNAQTKFDTITMKQEAPQARHEPAWLWLSWAHMVHINIADIPKMV